MHSISRFARGKLLVRHLNPAQMKWNCKGEDFVAGVFMEILRADW